MEEKRISQRLKGIDLDRWNELVEIFGQDKMALSMSLLSWDNRLSQIKNEFLYKLLCDAASRGVNVATVFSILRASINKKEKRERRLLLQKI